MKLMLSRLFFFLVGKFFSERKLMLKPLTSKGSVQKVSIMVVVSNFIDRNFLFDEIWMVCVSLSTFLSARASAISFVLSNLVFSLYRVCWMPFMEVVTVL